MRIALTGASSSGKTTLARRYVDLHPSVPLVNVDARKLLDELGVRNTSTMSSAVYSKFQRRYVAVKASSESRFLRFLTERSFVDAYAFWLVHCAADASARENRQMLQLCKRFASNYHYHFFLPYGLVPHADDGYRHPDRTYHYTISGKIYSLLCEWELPFETLEVADLAQRIERMHRALGQR